MLAVITGRRSVRAFSIVAFRAGRSRRSPPLRRAPSGNSQPWHVHVLSGPAKARLSVAILAERASGAPEPALEYHYYPDEWPDPYLDRRREVGWAARQRSMPRGTCSSRSARHAPVDGPSSGSCPPERRRT